MDRSEKLIALRKLPHLLARMLGDAAPEFHRLRPRAGGFSLVEHICYLRDLEQQDYAVRIRRMLDEQRPELVEFDGDKVARESDYHSQDPNEALAVFDAARGASIALFGRMTEEWIGEWICEISCRLQPPARWQVRRNVSLPLPKWRPYVNRPPDSTPNFLPGL